MTASSTLNKNNTHYSQKKWLETQFFFLKEEKKKLHPNLRTGVTKQLGGHVLSRQLPRQTVSHFLYDRLQLKTGKENEEKLRSYMQLISAVRCHRFKGLGVPIVPLLTQREQMNIIFILHYYYKSSVNGKYLFKGPKKFLKGEEEKVPAVKEFNLQIEQSNFLHQRQSPS